MAENTTEPPIRVNGEERPHPAVRRLARACIALVRWQRQQAAPPTAAPAPDMGTGMDGTADTTTAAPRAGGTGAAHD